MCYEWSKFGRISGADPSKQANTGRSISPKAFNKLNATTKINKGRSNEKGIAVLETQEGFRNDWESGA